MSEFGAPVADNVQRIAHLDLPGAGQVRVEGELCFLGHIPNVRGLGTTIVDVADPRNPRVLTTIPVGDPESHSHKVRVAGDIMIVNHERNNTGVGRKAEQLLPARTRLLDSLGRPPTDAELAIELGVQVTDLEVILNAEASPYDQGGFRVYDIADPTNPQLLCHHKTGGKGVHRFDMDENYAYISTEMDGYQGNILVIYDMSDPSRPQEVSRWHMPGQHLSGGETPTWEGKHHRLHHALRFGDRLYAGMWHAGFRIIDIADITAPKTIGAYNYHPPFPEPTHTVMPVPGRISGRKIMLAVDEEDKYYNADEAKKRRGRPHANMWTFDITDPSQPQPLALFQVGELDSPYSRTPHSRFGAHQFQEHMSDTKVCCAWFSGGVRIVDVADPFAPQEVGSYIPNPVAGQPAPQTNDVDVDARGLIHIVDRNVGYDILEFKGH